MPSPAVALPERMMKRGSGTVRTMNVPIILILGVLGFLTFLPFMVAISISFKSIFQFTMSPFLPGLPLTFSNYAVAYRLVIGYITNSVFVSSLAVVLTLIIGLMSAYVFARFDFPFKTVLFFVFLSLMMIPSVLSLVTRFLMVNRLGLRDNYLGLILPYASGGQLIVIFIGRTFFESIPKDLFECAKLDSANELQIISKIVLPMSMPIVSTLIILDVVSTWNNILWPLIILTSKKLYPVSVGLLQFKSEAATNVGAMMAGYLITSIPLIILFAFASKQFVKGLTSGAVKF